jgi:hypothetical protein
MRNFFELKTQYLEKYFKRTYCTDMDRDTNSTLIYNALFQQEAQAIKRNAYQIVKQQSK